MYILNQFKIILILKLNIFFILLLNNIIINKININNSKL